ncbi:hypothetical protein PRIC2_002456 [Phytophthora ramorum]
MVFSSSILPITAALVVFAVQVNAHGYVSNPLSEFVDSETSAWVVQIDPQWAGDWDSCSSDDNECLTTLYTSLKESNGYSDIRTLLDSDTSLYGADCGFTDPNATPKDPPSTGDATFSRGMVHAGPCEIWLDDTKVLSNDNCMPAYGDGTQEKASVFSPVDYSSCPSGGCTLRFYWLAFQGLDSSTVWQVYKNCVPLTGPAGGTSSTTTTTSSTSTGSTATESSGESTTTASSSVTTTSSGSAEASTSAPESSTSQQESTSAPESSKSESSQDTTSYTFGQQSTETPSSNTEESKTSDSDEQKSSAESKKDDEDESDKKSEESSENKNSENSNNDDDSDRQRLRQ